MKKVDDFVVVYDISDDNERRKVDKTLKGFGFRVQKSVFECKLDQKVKERLLRRLEAIDIQTGFIKIYKLETLIGSKTIGNKPSDIDSGSAYIV